MLIWNGEALQRCSLPRRREELTSPLLRPQKRSLTKRHRRWQIWALQRCSLPFAELSIAHRTHTYRSCRWSKRERCLWHRWWRLLSCSLLYQVVEVKDRSIWIIYWQKSNAISVIISAKNGQDGASLPQQATQHFSLTEKACKTGDVSIDTPRCSIPVNPKRRQAEPTSTENYAIWSDSMSQSPWFLEIKRLTQMETQQILRSLLIKPVGPSRNSTSRWKDEGIELSFVLMARPFLEGHISSCESLTWLQSPNHFIVLFLSDRLNPIKRTRLVKWEGLKCNHASFTWRSKGFRNLDKSYSNDASTNALIKEARISVWDRGGRRSFSLVSSSALSIEVV